MLIACAALFLLGGCVPELRRVDFSASGNSKAQDLSYLLVDKSDYSADGAVLVERIDDREVDLLLDPALYVLDSGNHSVSFSFRDFRSDTKSDHTITAGMQAGRYYQIAPVRVNEKISFSVSEIVSNKAEAVAKREFGAMKRYLWRGEK